MTLSQVKKPLFQMLLLRPTQACAHKYWAEIWQQRVFEGQQQGPSPADSSENEPLVQSTFFTNYECESMMSCAMLLCYG